MRNTICKHLFWIVLLLVAIATAAKAMFNATFDDFKSRGETESWSAPEAVGRGILVEELVAVPNELSIPEGRVSIDEVWIEERSLPTHEYVWLPTEKRFGGYRLQFTLKGGKELMRSSKLVFSVKDGKQTNYAGTISSSDGREIYSLCLASPDVLNLRLSLARMSDDHVFHEVRFVPRLKQ